MEHICTLFKFQEGPDRSFTVLVHLGSKRLRYLLPAALGPSFRLLSDCVDIQSPPPVIHCLSATILPGLLPLKKIRGPFLLHIASDAFQSLEQWLYVGRYPAR